MKVVLLCGGLGTRLREETEYRPKPLVDVGGHPILWHIMKGYAHYGYNDFVCCLGYRGQMIKEYFLSYETMNNDFTVQCGRPNSIAYHGPPDKLPFNVTLSDTGQETMTGGRILRIQKYIDGDEFMVTYGDGVADVDVDKLLAFHRSHGRIATVTAMNPPWRFGVVDLALDGRVEQFVEKPRADAWASAGFFVFNRKVFDYLTGDDCILEQAPLERLAQEGELMAYRHAGFFYAMDTYREFVHLNELWASGKAPWKVW